ncbi:N-acetyltransferase family protein [Qipengyuania nanhaisediminis]|uniref:GNAT family N-acetyltransferase n=1 Tax=Qipengyuania nanhaisediminis TaxID=604088 RepID=UPI0038B3E3D0
MSVIHTRLQDGTPVCIREVRKDDEARLKAGIARMSKQSRYLRFFSGMTVPPQHVIDRLVDADGHSHIAWGALRSDREDTPALGVVHAFRDEDDPSQAEFSVAVIDEYHGRGLARLLTLVMLIDCQREGLKELSVHLLSENEAARRMTRSLGGVKQGSEGAVVEFEIDIEQAIASLKHSLAEPGLSDVLKQLG